MASIKINYTMQSCSSCGTELLSVPTGSPEIGSPLITCRHCDKTYRTNLRVEWYAYRHKWLIYGMAPLLFVTMTLFGSIMSDPVIGIMAGFLGLFIGLCMTIKEIPRIVKSKRRMRSAAYLNQLNEYALISPEDYARFRAKADKP